VIRETIIGLTGLYVCPASKRPGRTNWGIEGIMSKPFAAYAEKNNRRASIELVVNFLAFLVFWAITYSLIKSGHYLWAAPIILFNGVVLVRLFVLQHDCGHNVFFSNHKWNNRVGKLISLFTLAPYDWWRKDHSKHHAQSGHLEKRGTGDIWLLTVQEYKELKPLKKFYYRLYRSAFVLLVIGPLLLFLVRMRIPDAFTRSHPKLLKSVLYTNVALVVFYGALLFIFEPTGFFITHLLTVMVASSLGVWMFTVQHTFEDAYWAHGDSWSFDEAAWKGSSVLRLGALFDFMTANICFHNIHHVNSQIPSYNLKRCYFENRDDIESREIFLIEALRVTKFKLWSEELGRMIRMSELPA